MSRKLEDLHPEMLSRANKFLERIDQAGLDVLVTTTWRSNAEQDQLYAIGRTKPGRIVTRAKGGQSNHNFMINGKPASLAFDVAPLRFGKLIWGTSGNGLDANPADDETDDLELWQRVGEIGKACGLQWYGDPDAPFREFPHFQLPNAAQIREAA